MPFASLNPFALKGAEFLVFLVPVLVAAACLGRLIRSFARSPGPHDGDEHADLTWERAAYLAGGYPRLTAAAVARLVACGAANIAPDGRHLLRGDTIPADGLSVAETIVHNLLPVANTAAALEPVIGAVEVRFAGDAAVAEADGLVMNPATRSLLKWVCALPVGVVLLTLAGPRLVANLLASESVLYLVLASLVGGVGAWAFAATGPDRLTRRGEAVLTAMQARHARLGADGWATTEEPALAVALFGTGALGGTKLTRLRDWLARPAD